MFDPDEGLRCPGAVFVHHRPVAQRWHGLGRGEVPTCETKPSISFPTDFVRPAHCSSAMLFGSLILNESSQFRRLILNRVNVNYRQFGEDSDD